MKKAIATIMLALPLLAGATTIERIGSYTNWTTDWTALSNINDLDDNLKNEEIDFVGDSSNAGGYYASNDDYVFFRMRVDSDSNSNFSDAHFLLIDIAGTGAANTPDYGFAWDSKSNDPTAHGLEMSILATSGSTWGEITMDDIDGVNGSKGDNDINGNNRDTDGYVRTIDEQSTENFGDTTYVDFAVSWNYLTTYTDLTQDQEWSIQFASIANATDHNAFDDVAGGAELSSATSVGWSDAIAIPEPASIALISLFGIGTIVVRRFFC